jgi:glycosyltransferase involved in cell wall biosynthesis
VRIAMIGTRGVPARYGGFETCVEEVGSRLVERGHEVTVYCRRSANQDSEVEEADHYRGMRRVSLPALHTRTGETLSHTAASVAHLGLHRTDVAFVFNAANAPLLPAVRGLRIPVATHVDGLEWMRAKWQGGGRRYYRAAESLAVRWSDALIADSDVIADYYATEFDAPTTRIAYGAPRVQADPSALGVAGLRPRGYHLAVARFEPENHVLEVVQGYTASAAQLPLVVVGAAPHAHDYTQRVRAAADDRVMLLGSVWDQALLDQMYANAATYVHGHSVGGSNPSLLRAIGAGAAVLAFDVPFNREVLRDAGRYFADPAQLTREIERAEADPEALTPLRTQAVVESGRYSWEDVASRYEALADRLAEQGPAGRRPSGRRQHAEVSV